MKRLVDGAAWAFVLIAAAIAISILVYAVVSFALMRPHAKSRTFLASLRELGREIGLAALTQPFLPLFYFVGFRMEPLFARRGQTDGGVPVVFVHGYMQNRVGFVGLARVLASRGIGPLYGMNYAWFAPIDGNARLLRSFVDRVCRETKSPVVDLVCHSMGGLVAMEMLRSAAEDHDVKVRRCVTIATPHAGVVWRGPLIGYGADALRRGSKLLEAHATRKLAVPTLSVFSSHDNVVHPKETSSLHGRGGRDVEVDGPGHLAILFAPQVAEQVAAFLKEPDVAMPAEMASSVAQ